MHPYIIGGHITTLSHKQGFKAFTQQSTRFNNVWEYISPALLLRPNIAFVSLYYDASPPTDADLHPLSSSLMEPNQRTYLSTPLMQPCFFGRGVGFRPNGGLGCCSVLVTRSLWNSMQR